MGLDGTTHEEARRERLAFASIEVRPLAMHFVERVLHDAGPSQSPQRRLETTLDAAIQRDVRGILEMQRAMLLRHGARSVAVAVLDNRSGEWLAWEGSGDYFGEGFGGAIDGVTTLRQPGSTLKPFTYAVALESGISPATVLPDIPSHFPTAEDGVLYTPRNYDGQYRGPMAIRTALAGSQNVPAVAMLSRIGPESLLRFLRNSGFTSLDRTSDYYGLGLTLGDAEVTLEQLVAAYAMLARGGESVRPVMLRGGGRELRRRLISERTAFWITDVLSDSSARAYAFGSGGSLDLPFNVAVKTGTSQAYRDNWTIGFTRELTVGVWVGNFDREPLRGSSGVTGAAPIFNAVMTAAVRRVRGEVPVGDMRPILEPPAGMEQLELCALSGARPSTWCPDRRREWLPANTPGSAGFCTWHRSGDIAWPPEYRAWAAQSVGSDLRSSLAPEGRAAGSPVGQRIGGQPSRGTQALAILNPADAATFMIDPTLRTEFQTVQLRAAASGEVEWAVDGRRLPEPEWPLTRGVHTITATTAGGQRASVRVFVK
jgi:penicillin-binding protein 1C